MSSAVSEDLLKKMKDTEGGLQGQRVALSGPKNVLVITVITE